MIELARIEVPAGALRRDSLSAVGFSGLRSEPFRLYRRNYSRPTFPKRTWVCWQRRKELPVTGKAATSQGASRVAEPERSGSSTAGSRQSAPGSHPKAPQPPPPITAAVAGRENVSGQLLRRWLGPSAFSVWVAAIWRRDRQGVSFATIKTLADAAQISFRATQRALAKLSGTELVKQIGWHYPPRSRHRRQARKVFGDYRLSVITVPKVTATMLKQASKRGGKRSGAGRPKTTSTKHVEATSANTERRLPKPTQLPRKRYSKGDRSRFFEKYSKGDRSFSKGDRSFFKGGSLSFFQKRLFPNDLEDIEATKNLTRYSIRSISICSFFLAEERTNTRAVARNSFCFFEEKQEPTKKPNQETCRGPQKSDHTDVRESVSGDTRSTARSASRVRQPSPRQRKPEHGYEGGEASPPDGAGAARYLTADEVSDLIAPGGGFVPHRPSDRDLLVPQLPDPPLLPEMPDLETAEYLVRIYRGLIETRTKEPCHILSRRGSVMSYRGLPALLAGACALREQEIAPAGWAAFSYDVWRGYLAPEKGDNGSGSGKKAQRRPPALGWTFLASRIEKHRSWFLRESGSYAGGRVLFSQLQSDVGRRWVDLARGLHWDTARRLKRDDKMTRAELLELIAAKHEEMFSGGFEGWLKRAREGGAAQKERLSEMIKEGKYVWS